MHSIFFANKDDHKENLPLPHWLVYVAYLLVFCSSSVSAFFVILYGFTFGKEKSDKWIISMITSITQSIFVIQPFKVKFVNSRNMFYCRPACYPFVCLN